jgi:hypothetical protein
MTISALYKVASGTYADNDMSVWVYDVTNSVLIQPSAYQIKNTTGVEQIKCEFQAASNSTSYRLIFHTASTSAVAYTLRFDSFSVSPNTYNTGASVTAPVSYTPTFTGFGTVSTSNFRSWRQGSRLFYEGTFTAGTPTAVEARISLGFGGVNGGITTDSSLPTLSSNGGWSYNGTGAIDATMLNEPSVSYVTFGAGTAGGTGLAKANGNAVASVGSIVSVFGNVQIAGWGTAQVLSGDTDTRVVAANIGGTFPGTYTANTAIVFFIINKDTHGVYSASTGEYTLPAPGYY